MKILITGICGFAGSQIARGLLEAESGLQIVGIDNFLRAGSELNRASLRSAGIKVYHGDVRVAEDLEEIGAVEFVIDAAANPSVLAGLDRGSASGQLMSHNLFGTVNVLEFCKRHKAGLVLLSTSRVYSIPPLAALKMEVHEDAFRPSAGEPLSPGLSPKGVSEEFSTEPPISLYGSTKICSEVLALEYAQAFDFPVWINRLGVLAGAGQFGRADQGIFSFWVHSCAERRPLKYIGFGGHGYQVRDCLHPRDLVSVLRHQLKNRPKHGEEITNLSGGLSNSLSLRQLHRWCEDRFGSHSVARDDSNRPYDVPWLVLDSSRAHARFGWQPATAWPAILEEIGRHAEENPKWLELTT
jgi:CDP-paratose 2-epimerase